MPHQTASRYFDLVNEGMEMNGMRPTRGNGNTRGHQKQGEGCISAKRDEQRPHSLSLKPAGGEGGLNQLGAVDKHIEFVTESSPSSIPKLGISVRESAKSLGMSEKHFRTTVLPNIPHVRLGRRIVIPVDGLREWLSERARLN
jgi:hypothetical protein